MLALRKLRCSIEDHEEWQVCAASRLKHSRLVEKKLCMLTSTLDRGGFPKAVMVVLKYYLKVIDDKPHDS